MALYRIALVVLCTGLPALAHYPEGITYQVFQFPDEHVPAMDGDLADWAVVPQAYIAVQDHHAQVKPEASTVLDTTDHHIKRAMVGWNDALNRLYFAAEIYDDTHRFHKENTDSLDTYYSRWKGAYVHGADIWEIVIDADHGGEKVVNFNREDDRVEMRHRSAYTQNYHLYMPPLNGSYWHWLWGQALWTADAAYSDMGWNFPGRHEEAGTVTYECYLTPFDDLHPDGPASSRLHDLRENAIIGLSWAFLDADEKVDKFDAFWSLSKEMKMYCMGEYLVDFRLMPVEENRFKGK